MRVTRRGGQQTLREAKPREEDERSRGSTRFFLEEHRMVT